MGAMRLLWFSILILVAAPLHATDAAGVGGCGGTVPDRELDADPATYLGLLDALVPGDLLRLAAGTYPGGLPIDGLDGEPDRCIIIEGPESGAPAIFTGRDCCNTISLSNSSYLVIRHLELDGDGRLGDGVKAESTSDSVHHLTLEDLYIHGHGADQQIVGVSSKCPAWNWVIRQSVIEGAGTGIYLGNSDGEDSFVEGLIEHNLVVDTVGYNLQIKHQNQRQTVLGQPAVSTTIIRHNVFSKANGGSTGGAARPNLLVGHWPLAGPGADDDYLIYGNFIYQNPDEALFQGEGNVIFYGNLLVNDFGPAVHIQPHNDEPRRVRLFQNTVVASTTGLSVAGGLGGFTRELTGNAVFAATPLSGGDQTDNVTDAYAAAADYLVNPDGAISGAADRLDLYPLSATLSGTAVDLSGLSAYEDWNRDFNGTPRPGTFRGAYAGEGVNPGWTLALERKPELDPTIFADGFESGDTASWSSTTGR